MAAMACMATSVQRPGSRAGGTTSPTPTAHSKAKPPTPKQASTSETDAGAPRPDAGASVASAPGAPFLPLDAATIEAAVQRAVDAGELPGCVVSIGRRGGVVFQRAYGHRALEPARERMTPDTLFDLASLTKPVVTATVAMQLIENGELRLDDPVHRWIPAFGRGTRRAITLRHLLTHTSGLPSVSPRKDFEHGESHALRRIAGLPLKARPGHRFDYSDLGYIVLGEVIERASGTSLDALARSEIFEPLGMRATRFRPAPDLRGRAAPTEKAEARGNIWIRGVVHDPRAWRLGGVAGNAGLFSTAADLSRFARMLLGRGELDGARVLSPSSMSRLLQLHRIGDAWRTPGWDVDSPYSRSRGALSPRAFGHTGFTGTSLWIDPALDVFVLLLSNRVHPDGHGDAHTLAATLAEHAARAAREQAHARTCSKPPQGSVETGIDVLRDRDFRPLRGRRIGLVTNRSGCAGDGVPTLRILEQAENVELAAIFTPEHGLYADLEGAVQGGSHSGVPVYSLFGARRRPDATQLQGVDLLVFDIQDVGTRFYTYMSTLHQLLQASAEHDIEVWVLDRPNPLGGMRVEGPLQTDGHRTFVNYHPLPVRHGMTAGELARLLNTERDIHADLHVVRMQGWDPRMHFEETGLSWVPPSPNLHTSTQALLYPAVGLLESTNLSVGRGTDAPFQLLGAPWMRHEELAASLAHAPLPGVRFEPVTFTPDAAVHENERCNGVRLEVTDSDAFAPVQTGLEIARQLRRLHPGEWRHRKMHRLLRHRRVLQALGRAGSTAELSRLWQADLQAFRRVRERYLLYPRPNCASE